jgi:apolipoprotein N-acyltransferase
MNTEEINKTSFEGQKENAVTPRRSHSMAYLIYRTRWYRFVLAGISGVLLLLSFPPFAYGMFGWLALVPLLLSIFSSPSWKVAGLSGLITGLVFYTVSLSFFWEVFGIFGLILSNLLTIYIAVFAISVWLLVNRIGLGKSFFFVPVFWVGIELFRSELYFLRFPWLSIGYSQAPYNVIIQVCDIVGVYGLSFIVLSVNALIAWFLLERIRRRRWAWGCWVVIIIIFAVLLGYGSYTNDYIPKYLESNTGKTRIPVLVVQDMIGSVDNYLMTTYEAVRGNRESLAVWPEVADSAILSTSSKRQLIEALVRDKKLYLITGTYEPTEEKIIFRNLAVIFSPEGDVIGEYAKQIPVQLVETAVIPGKRSGIFETPLGKIGVLICYEGGFSNLTLRLAKKDVDFIVIPTLERGGWGGLSHNHHASMIPFRAVETRRPVIRSAALGISMIVHPSGKVESQINHLASGVIKSEIEVPKNNQQTFYVSQGYLFPRLCLLIYSIYFCITVIIIFIRNIKNFGDWIYS